MEGSVSEKSEITEASVGSCYDFSDLSNSIQDLELGKETRTTSSSSLSQTQKNEQAIAPEDLWAYHTHINAGYTLPSNMHSHQESFTGSMNYINQYMETQSVLRNPTNVYPRMGDYRLNYNHPRIDQIASTNHYEFEPTRSDSTYSGNSYYFPNTIGSSSGLSNQQGVRSNLVRRATEEDRSKGLERFSQYQNPEIANMVFGEVSESIFELMTDHYGHKLYEKLIERCDDYHLARIVNKLTLQSNALVGASFTKYGSYSIQALIKRLKGSEWAKLVTTNLSMPNAFRDLMRNKHGRHVVNQCFFKLDTWTNRVLFDAAIEHCVELAMDPVGCVSIIDCINSVRIPEQKKLLLQRISINSLRLSFDTSGTFVVQHILEVGNDFFSDMICHHLKGKYVMLSQLQCGSFIVEKCLRASKLGLHYFVEDIKDNEDILKKLAHDKFGNYVIQTALEISKEDPSLSYLNEFLVSTLQPYLPQLAKTRARMNVVRKILDQGQFEKLV